MNGITRFHPLSSELSRFDPLWDIDNMFNKFMMHPSSHEEAEMEPPIKMDVKEADGKYLVNAEIPGMNKDDIHVTIEGRSVHISAEAKQKYEASERVIRSECNCGMISRSFTLADEIEQNQIQARYHNGILELTLPKKTRSMRKEITIS